MAFLSRSERTFLRAVSQLAYCNPFLPERVEHERAALGGDFVEGEPVWSLPVDQPEQPRANVWRVAARLEPLGEQMRSRLRARPTVSREDLALYGDAVLALLYQGFYSRFHEAELGHGPQGGAWRFYQDFLADGRYFYEPDGVEFPPQDPCHAFACFRQIQRAFEQIFR